MHEPRKPNDRFSRFPVGIALGNLALGIGISLALGVAFGIALQGGRPGGEDD